MPEFVCQLRQYHRVLKRDDAGTAGRAGHVRQETIMRLEKAPLQSLIELAIDISRVVEQPIEKLLFFD